MSQKFHITCTLPNASLKINEIDFVQVAKGVIMTAETVGAEIADHFREIPGYLVEELDEAEAEAIAEAERVAAAARERVLTKARAKASGKAAPAPAPAPSETPVIDAASAAAAAGGDTKAIQDAADAAAASKPPEGDAGEGSTDQEPAKEPDADGEAKDAAKAGEELF